MSNSQGLIMFLKHFNTFVIFFYENLSVIDVIFSVHIFFFLVGQYLNISNYISIPVFFFFFNFYKWGRGGRQWPPLPYCRSITEELDKIYKIYLIDTDRLGKKISPQFFLPLSFFTIFFSIIRW